RSSARLMVWTNRRRKPSGHVLSPASVSEALCHQTEEGVAQCLFRHIPGDCALERRRDMSATPKAPSKKNASPATVHHSLGSARAVRSSATPLTLMFGLPPAA